MIKTTGEVSDRAYKIARPFSMAAAIILAIFYVATANRTNLFQNFTEYGTIHSSSTCNVNECTRAYYGVQT